jgi:DNA (cytosine-5)-methyltransferase 1
VAGVKPRLLDLFCGAGGASRGYHDAGFEIRGVDIKPQPHYPYTFLQMDALAFLETLIATGEVDVFDAIHASPPCQAYSVAAQSERNAGKEYPDLLAATRTLLEQTGLPWVIENVPGAPMRCDISICGCQVGLELRRIRWFETSWHAFQMAAPHHHPHPVPSVVGHGTPSWVRDQLGYNPTIADYRASMGIDWMNRDELSQAIPPAYTELIGHQLQSHLASAAESRCLMQPVSFKVFGIPQPAGSKRGFRNPKTGGVIITDANSKAKPWQAEVRNAAAAAMSTPADMLGPLLDGPLLLELTFWMPRPKGHFGAKGNVKPKSPRFPTVKPDVLKLARAVEDALTGIVYRDDSQIVSETLQKAYGEPARVEVRVVPIGRATVGDDHDPDLARLEQPQPETPGPHIEREAA